MTYAPDLIEKMARAYRNFKHPGMRPLWRDLSADWRNYYWAIAEDLLTKMENQGLTVTEDVDE